MPIPSIRKLPYILFTAAWLAAGMIIHLQVHRHDPGRIWGDAGDGYFNLWILDHTFECLRQGRIGDIPDGRIFAPEESPTFFWSDNLIIPSFFYTAFRLAGITRFTAFLWTGHLLMAVFFLSLCFLLLQCHRLGRETHAGWPAWAPWFIAPVAYAGCFTPGILTNAFEHFQNLSAGWIMLMAGAMVSTMRRPTVRAILWVAGALTALLYTSLYIAVIGMIFCLIWGVTLVLQDIRTCARMVLRASPVLVILAAAAIWMGWQYYRVPHQERPVTVIKELSIGFEHVYTPSAGSLHDQLARREIPLRTHPEKPAYPGAGILLGIGLSLAAALAAAPRVLRHNRPAVTVLALLAASALFQSLNIPGIEPFRATGAALLLAAALATVLWAAVRRYRDGDRLQSALILLLLLAAIAYGIANGPRSRFLEAAINPSIWGIHAWAIPGVSRMRAVGRLAVVGQGLLVAALFMAAMRAATRSARARRMILPLIVMVLSVQIADLFPLRAYSHPYDPRSVTPTDEEAAFLGRIQGTVLVLPAGPFHRNARAMLFFTAFPRIRLMNGYSSRSTPLWDRIMLAGRTDGEGCPAQLQAAREADAAWLIVFKTGVHRHWLREWYSWPPTARIFDNDRLLVMPLAGEHRETHSR